MPLPSKLRRRVGDAVDAERRVLPPLAAAYRQPSICHSLWSVEEPELARNASHLRAIARQQQSLWTKPTPQPQTMTVGSVRVSPRAPATGLLPLKTLKQTRTNTNNNDSEGDTVLQEIWRVAEAAAKQQSSTAVGFTTKSRSVETAVEPRGPVGNQEAETNDGNGTTKARYRRLVGMFARKALVRIIHQAAVNVVRMRLENGCAVSIQRVARRFLGHCRRARLRFAMVNAVEKIERQWTRTKARRVAAIQRKERERRDQERKKAEEERQAAARDIKTRYREFVELKQKRKKAREEKEAESREQQQQQQQRMADEETRRTAAAVIQRTLRNARGNARDMTRGATRGVDTTQPWIEVVDAQSVHAVADVSSWGAAIQAVEGCTDDSESVVDTRVPAEERRMIEDTVEPQRIPPTVSEPTYRARVCPDAMSVDILSKPAAVTLSVAIATSESGLNESLPCEPEPVTLPNVGSQVGVQEAAPKALTSSDSGSSIPARVEDTLPVIDTSDVGPSPLVSARALRRARAVIGRFLVTRCLSHLRDQLHTKHAAALQLQQLVRCRLARRRVAFQRQLHLVSLRSELQAEWLQFESRFMANILGDDTPSPEEHLTTQPPHHEAADDDDERQEEEEEDFLLDEGDDGGHVHSAIGMAWAELLPTRSGVIPSGLRLDLSASHGPSSAAAPSLGLWKWSWASQHWQPNRDLFSIANTSPEA